ncbi:MAG: hypothetical protein NXI13_16400 [Proteobacteria bacterium]|nr:hypothetical protein [Pseudomonadota bacterium]
MSDKLKLARERFERAYSFDLQNQKEMIEDLEFKVGDQWPQEVINERQGRPCLTINRMPQFINQVINDIRLNSPSIKTIATEDADVKIAEVYTGLIRSIEDRSDASIAYETAADGAASCGIGHFFITTEDGAINPFELDIKIKRIADHTSVIWDPDARDFTKEDAKYCFVSQYVTEEEFKEQYPKATLSSFETDNTESYLNRWYGEEEKIRVAEYWYKKPKKQTMGLLPDKRVVPLTKEIRIALEQSGIEIVREKVVETNTVEFMLMSGSEILEGPVEFPSKFIPIVSVIGDETHIGQKVVRSGLIRHAKDPQRMYNYWRSASTEAVALAPKAPFIVTKKQIKGLENHWQNANRQNSPYLVYEPDPAAPPPSREPMAGISPGMLQETATASDDMKAVTGIYDSSLGASSQEKSGKAIMARERQGDVGTFQYADNLRRALTYAGKILIDMIPRIYDTERTVRILGADDSEEFVTLYQEDKDGNILNLAQGHYDVSVKTGPSFSTQREEARESLMGFVSAFPAAAQVAGDLIAKTMDWPGAQEFAERLKKIIPAGIIEDEDRELDENGQPIPTPEEQQQAQMLQMQQEAAIAEIQQKVADAEKAQAEARRADAMARKEEAELVMIAKTAAEEEQSRTLDLEEKALDIELKEKELTRPLDG